MQIQKFQYVTRIYWNFKYKRFTFFDDYSSKIFCIIEKRNDINIFINFRNIICNASFNYSKLKNARELTFENKFFDEEIFIPRKELHFYVFPLIFFFYIVQNYYSKLIE